MQLCKSNATGRVSRFLSFYLSLRYNHRTSLDAGCTKEFNRPDKLKAHIIAHAGAKPHRCQTCGRAFTRRPHLREHERCHAENFRFWCERCRQGFMRPNLLKQHNCADATSSAAGPRHHAFTRKVGRPRKNPPLPADSSTPVTDEPEACNEVCRYN